MLQEGSITHKKTLLTLFPCWRWDCTVENLMKFRFTYVGKLVHNRHRLEDFDTRRREEIADSVQIIQSDTARIATDRSEFEFQILAGKHNGQDWRVVDDPLPQDALDSLVKKVHKRKVSHFPAKITLSNFKRSAWNSFVHLSKFGSSRQN